MRELTEAPKVMSEADLCAAFIASATKRRRDQPEWIAYPETAGFDILLVRKPDGVQVGVEAKLALNPRVVAQALPSRATWAIADAGPDYRAVLVPAGKCNADVAEICRTLGITVLTYRGERGSGYYGLNSSGPAFTPDLPVENHWFDVRDWYEWAPASRCEVPDYVPDVAAGASAPVALTAWKVRAIKLLCLLEHGPVTRADFKHLGLSPTSWTQPQGWLDRTEGGFIAGERTPNLRRQHPINFEQIRADKTRWLVGPLAAGRTALNLPAREGEGA